MAYEPNHVDCEACEKKGFIGYKVCGDCQGSGERKRRPDEHAHTPVPASHADLGIGAKAGCEADPEALEELAALDRYLAVFAKPTPHERRGSACFHCGAYLAGGGMVVALMGDSGFRWGLAHGEGHCAACGWPARAYHRDPSPGISFLPAVLQYLPAEPAEQEVAA